MVLRSAILCSPVNFFDSINARREDVLLYTECQSSFIPVYYWLRTYHVIVEKFYYLPGNVAKRWTLLLIPR